MSKTEKKKLVKQNKSLIKHGQMTREKNSIFLFFSKLLLKGGQTWSKDTGWKILILPF